MSSAPQAILDLVERFRHNLDYYHRPDYNETQVRIEFIDPFFEALGWDVANRAGRSPRYQHVVHEATVRVGTQLRSPDYCFQIGGNPLFFVEAKKPSVDIRRDASPAYQLRIYAWNAKLPLSILTDFDEFSVYEGRRVRPAPKDDPATARVLCLTYEEYPERWHEIASVFSLEAVERGDYMRFAEANESKRGTQEVNEALVQQLESWRVLLARNLALRNPGLSARDLNYAVQKILDRIIFLRICEDRQIEPYEQLRNVLSSADHYVHLRELFRRADARYNSGLFHFRHERGRGEAPDTLTPTLALDNRVLREIIGQLYYPESPYAFDAISPDILGNVYERFLGSVIRLTQGHRAVVEQKPEVRKAGGVYYTPKYIVDYIVAHTVGELVKDKTPGQIADVRILDPACGSGSFLLGAYQYLLDWYRDWYAAHPTRLARKELYQAENGEWRLTIAEKKRILLTHLYGVDIDPQAVEVTKLSLLLAALRGETAGTLQLELLPERALPDLANNIKCGNSLIGPDFYDGQQTAMFDEEEWYRVNAFDWQARFPEVFEARGQGSGDRGRGSAEPRSLTPDPSSRGFDAVIGNPPYVRIQTMASETKEYLWKHYSAFQAKSDVYACFVQQSIQLLRPDGRMSFITPNTWTSLESFAGLREYVLTHTALEETVRVPTKVFKDATVRTFIFVLSKLARPGVPKDHVVQVRSLDEGGSDRDEHRVSQVIMFDSHLHNLLLEADPDSIDLLHRCSMAGCTVGERFQFFYGFKTADDERFLCEEATTEQHRPYVRSASVTRYGPLKPDGYVDYRPAAMRANRSTARPGDSQRFERPKLIVARMGHELVATVDSTGMYVKD
ncbi:MAG: restriction endonuclease subunit M, partial [Chloroflexi bacterium]|nr:restriction endonuclease subunit M [Chloroflexota bacterium]